MSKRRDGMLAGLTAADESRRQQKAFSIVD
jgi:hypothetical protein